MTKKIRGDVGSGGFNTSLGKRNPTPPAKDTSPMTVKHKGVHKVSTRFPYDSSKGEIRNHKGL